MCGGHDGRRRLLAASGKATHAAVGVHHEWNEFLVRSERGLLVLAIFERLRGLDGIGFGVALALAGLRLVRRVLSLADDVCDRGVEQEGCGVGA